MFFRLLKLFSLLGFEEKSIASSRLRAQRFNEILFHLPSCRNTIFQRKTFPKIKNSFAKKVWKNWIFMALFVPKMLNWFYSASIFKCKFFPTSFTSSWSGRLTVKNLGSSHYNLLTMLIFLPQLFRKRLMKRISLRSRIIKKVVWSKFLFSSFFPMDSPSSD